MTMVALGLNLIYGFNGQFSLGQWGFYGIGAYAAADVTYRWVNGDASGLIVLGVGTILAGIIILVVGRLLSNLRRMPVLSSFTIYLVGAILSGYVAVMVGRWLSPVINPCSVTVSTPARWRRDSGCRLSISWQSSLRASLRLKSASCSACPFSRLVQTISALPRSALPSSSIR